MRKYNYTTSKDYRKLYQHLLQYPEEAIVCFLKENYGVQLCYVKNRGEFVEVGSLGVSWLIAKNIEDFVQSCEKYQLEYIESKSFKGFKLCF